MLRQVLAAQSQKWSGWKRRGLKKNMGSFKFCELTISCNQDPNRAGPCGSSGRKPTEQVQGPEFKPQQHKKKKKKNPNYGVEPHGCHGQKVPPEIAFCRKKVLIGTTTALKHYQAGHYRALTMA
jgi:hypothetical protein